MLVPASWGVTSDMSDGQQQRKTTDALRGSDSAAGLPDWAGFPSLIWQPGSVAPAVPPRAGRGRRGAARCRRRPEKSQARNKMALHASVPHLSRLTGRIIGSLSVKCARNTTLPAARRYISTSAGNSEWLVVSKRPLRTLVAPVPSTRVARFGHISPPNLATLSAAQLQIGLPDWAGKCVPIWQPCPSHTLQ